jgi:hypothetical protein
VETIRVRKLEAAHRQLETAVQLFFNIGDPVAIHTLACAAYDIIDGVNQGRGGKEVFIKRRYTQMPGRPNRAVINSVQNFFKHADKDPEGEMDFAPEMTEAILAEACQLYMGMTGENLPSLRCFECWFKSRGGLDNFVFQEDNREFVTELLRFFAQGDRHSFALRFLSQFDSGEDESLVDELLASNPKFRELVAKSKASPRKEFRADTQ